VTYIRCVSVNTDKIDLKLFQNKRFFNIGLNNINAELFCQTVNGITHALCDISALSLRGNVDITWY